jgi:hypothetical protein
VAVTAVPGTIRLPPRLAASPTEVPTSAEQAWADTSVGELAMQRDDEAGLSSGGFMITPGPAPGLTFVREGACAQSFDGRLAEVRRVFWVNASHPRDTVFAAGTDIPVSGEVQLGAAVAAPTRAGRERLLSTLASIRLQTP